MDTQLLTTSEGDIRRAGRIINAGGIVAFPTETVYGLGANSLSERAVANVYEAKGRPSDNPMIVHIADISDIAQLTDELPYETRKAMDELWPGPITFVLPKSENVPSITTGGLNTVAVRMPANPVAQALIRAAGKPIAAPSANLSGKPSPTSYEDVLEDMDGRIDAIIMGDQCEVGIESTVLDMTGDVPTILRPGYITAERLEKVLGCKVEYDKSLLEKPGEDIEPLSPGMKYTHYSPKAKVRIVAGSDESAKKYMIKMGLAARQNGFELAILDYQGDVEKAARKFFADLRELDRLGYDIILVRALEEKEMGLSVMNRMLKSAGYDVVE